MAVETNKDLIRSYFGALERGAVEDAAAFWAPEAINYAAGRPGQQAPPGRDGVRRVVLLLRAAFPDRRWQIDDMIAEADTVACRMTVSGTFGEKPEAPDFPVPADWPGVEGTGLIATPATGKPYSVKHVHVFQIVDGQITGHWAARDDLGLLLQLGALSIPVQAQG